jgi:fumarylacetoacetase
MQDTLNDFISDGQKHGVWFGIELQNFWCHKPKLQNNAKDLDIIIFRMEDVEMQLPVQLGITLILL